MLTHLSRSLLLVLLLAGVGFPDAQANETEELFLHCTPGECEFSCTATTLTTAVSTSESGWVGPLKPLCEIRLDSQQQACVARSTAGDGQECAGEGMFRCPGPQEDFLAWLACSPGFRPPGTPSIDEVTALTELLDLPGDRPAVAPSGGDAMARTPEMRPPGQPTGGARPRGSSASPSSADRPASVGVSSGPGNRWNVRMGPVELRSLGEDESRAEEDARYAAVVQERHRTLEQCIERSHLRGAEAASGNVEVHFVVAPDGSVVSVEVRRVPLGFSRRATHCVEGHVRQMSFPPSARGGIVRVQAGMEVHVTAP